MSWNLLVTAHRFESKQAQRQLFELAGIELRPTSFRDVLVGYVDKKEALFEALAKALGASRPAGAPVLVPAFARLVPLEESFPFKPEELLEELKTRIAAYAPRIPAGASLAVRVERRGFKGVLNSQELERKLSEHLFSLLEQQGRRPRFDLEDPDFAVAVETVGAECGLGLVAKELRNRFAFVRVD